MAEPPEDGSKCTKLFTDTSSEDENEAKGKDKHLVLKDETPTPKSRRTSPQGTGTPQKESVRKTGYRTPDRSFKKIGDSPELVSSEETNYTPRSSQGIFAKHKSVLGVSGYRKASTPTSDITRHSAKTSEASPKSEFQLKRRAKDSSSEDDIKATASPAPSKSRHLGSPISISKKKHGLPTPSAEPSDVSTSTTTSSSKTAIAAINEKVRDLHSEVKILKSQLKAANEAEDEPSRFSGERRASYGRTLRSYTNDRFQCLLDKCPFDGCRAEVRELKEEIDHQLETRNAGEKKLIRENQKLTKERNGAIGKREEALAEVEECKSKTIAAVKESKSLRKNVESLQEQLAAADGKYKRLELSNRILKESVEALEKQLNAAHTKSDKAVRSNSEADRQHDKTVAELAGKVQELEVVTKERDDAVAGKWQLQVRLNNVQGDPQSIAAKLLAAEKHIAAMEAAAARKYKEDIAKEEARKNQFFNGMKPGFESQ